MFKKILVGLALTASVLGAVGTVFVLRRHHTPVQSAEVKATARALIPLRVAELIYDGRLATGWEDWGWGPHQLPTQTGPAKISFAGYGGILVHHVELRERYGAVSFRYRAPPEWSEFLSVSLKLGGTEHAAFPVVQLQMRHLATVGDGWQEALVSWSELNPSNLPVDGISIAARSSVGSDWVQLDKIMLTKPDAPGEPIAGPAREVSLQVQCGAATHPISPLIYGASSGDWSAGITTQRIGGNPMTRLNWDLTDTWNTGSDWFFENVKNDAGGLWQWLEAGTSHHVQTALTVPMIGWVAKDGVSVGFPRSKFGTQRKHDEHRPEAGDGFRSDGTMLTPGPPTETSVAAPPEVIARWIRMVRARDDARGERSVSMYLLDNEPSLWNATHRDVHPAPLTYDELLDRTIRYASAVREADPQALIGGPCEWGWTGYFYSGADRENGTGIHSDRRAHGNTALVPWYLQQLASYEKANGKRLLDDLDLHFYPAAQGIYGAGARTDAAGSELRLRSTRALWDRGYRDESWINEPVALIPLMKDWVSKNYPGLKTSIGEWSFGADDHISGALATVEALGRFGQEGLDSAFYWDGPKVGTKTLQAFRAFRDFDGKGGRFQDLSVATRDAEKVSLFASRNPAGDRLVLIVVNEDSLFSVNATIGLDQCGVRLSQRNFSYGATSTTITEQLPVGGDKASTIVSLPPYSFMVLDIQTSKPR